MSLITDPAPLDSAPVAAMGMPAKPAQGASQADSISASASRRLRSGFAAVRVSFTWMGVRKSLNSEQKAQAAEGFGAEGAYLSAGKKLLDTKHPAVRRVTAVRGRVLSFWRGTSLPYPEPGVRLIRREDVAGFDARMGELREELDGAVGELNEVFAELKAAARQRLGRLFNTADYPHSLRGLFAVEWDFPSVEPPDYLRRLNPELYEQERQRMAARFDEAARLAEEAFIQEFSRLVSHLSERLAGGVDGRKKVFRDSAVANLGEFFSRFKNLSVGSNAELERLVESARQAVAGVRPQAVRDSDALRNEIATKLSTVRSVLDGMLVDQPRRKVLRPTHSSERGVAS